MSSPVEIYNSVQAIASSPQISFVASYGSQGGTVQLVVSAYALSTQNATGKTDYYLLDLSGTWGLLLNPTLYCDGYTLTVAPQANMRLVSSAPATTTGEVTASASTSTTISGEVGFSGADPGVSAGLSYTTENSNSVTLPGAVVLNLPYTGGTQNASWHYLFNESSPLMQGAFSHAEQVLFQVDRSNDANGATFQMTLDIHVSDHDGNDGTSYFDDFHSNFPLPAGASFNYTNDRIGVITVPFPAVTIAQPPLAC